MAWLWLGGWLVLGAMGDDGAVYHYRDAQGVDHYVNHPELVPSGISSDRLELGADLNPELAREMAESARSAAEVAKARAGEEKARDADAERKGIPVAPNPAGVPPPPETRLVLIWAIAFTIVFAVLWVTRGLLLHRSPPLAVAFQPVRWGTGVAALLSWILLAVLARGWIVDHFPPLRSISQAQVNVEKINREHRDSERELDKALNGK
jgi:hypothetical protein